MLRSMTGANVVSSALPRRALFGIALAGSLIVGVVAAPAAAASTEPITLTTTNQVALTLTGTDFPWWSVERYDLYLVNCTRTGGWVLTDGTCSGYASGHYSAYVAPLTYSAGISDKVSRPYARLIAMAGVCSHVYTSDPGLRFRRAGYFHWTWGENIGCRDGYGTVKAAVLASHLHFQAEKYTNGGHWRNIKNRAYRYVGIGVWRSGVKTRLVNDFYA